MHGRLRPDETVHIGGAGGNVGHAGTVLAHEAGARALANARPRDHDRIGAAGADVVLDYRDRTIAAALRAAAPGGLDVFWDTSGHHDLDLVAEVVAPGARVLLTAAAIARPVLPADDLYRAPPRPPSPAGMRKTGGVRRRPQPRMSWSDSTGRARVNTPLLMRPE